MATISGETFFGGKPPKQAAAASAPSPLDGFGIIDRIGADFKTRTNQATDAQVKAIEGKQKPISAAVQTIGAGAGFINDLGMEALKSLDKVFTGGKVGELASSYLEKAASTPENQQRIKQLKGWAEAHPEAAANLGAFVDIASLVPVGKVASVTVKGAAKGAEVGARAASEAATVGGRAVSGAGEAVYKSAITPNVAEAERMLNYEAKVPFLTRVSNTLTGKESPLKPVTRGDTALERGLLGRQKDIGVQATREADKLYTQKIAPAVTASPVRVTKEDLFAPIEKRIADTAEPGRKQAFTDAFEAIQHDYRNTADLSLEQAQKIKHELDTFTPAKVFRGQDIVNEYRTLQNDMANAIRQKTYDALSDQNIKKAYLDYGNLAELKKIGVKALTDATSKGGFGSFWTGVWDMATVPVKTVGGQVLYRVGNKLEFIGEKGTKTFGQFLEKNGYVRPSLSASRAPRTPAK
jgi:hypothetical protein